jgi:MinD-like ATPase involved in chromosome partitioning or flagellar assembly
LYVSFEQLNTTEMFFHEGNATGLFDVFCVIAEGGGVPAAIDSAKMMDASRVAYLTKFPRWSEVIRISPEDIKCFIDAARSANEIDLVVLDFGSGFSAFTVKALECCDEAFMVSETHSMSMQKLGEIFGEKNTHISDLLDNVRLIFNKTQEAPRETHGREVAAVVPNYQGATVKDVALLAERALRGLIKKTWIHKSETI